MAGKTTLDGELMFPSEYIAAPDLKKRDHTLTIAKVDMEELTLRGGAKKTKPVLWFVGAKKRFVCNTTNADSIAQMYGTEARQWIGKRITLYPTKVKFGKQMVDAVRVREQMPAGLANGQSQTQAPVTASAPQPEPATFGIGDERAEPPPGSTIAPDEAGGL